MTEKRAAREIHPRAYTHPDHDAHPDGFATNDH
jgi:hypothetical protein